MSNSVFVATVISLAAFMLGTVLTVTLILSARISDIGARINDLGGRVDHLSEVVETLREDVAVLKATQ